MKLSIIIALYDSNRFIESLLTSLNFQNLNYSDCEILLIVGDNREYDWSKSKIPVRKIENCHRDPLSAKLLGVHEARGDYLFFLDHDEVLLRKSHLSKMISCMDNHTDVDVVLSSGYVSSNDAGLLAKYQNNFGDPISSFLLYNNKNPMCFWEHIVQKVAQNINPNDNYIIFPKSVDRRLLIEVVAMGTLVRKSRLKKYLDSESFRIDDKNFFVSFQNNLGIRYILIRNFPLLHLGVENWSRYQAKLKWRIDNALGKNVANRGVSNIYQKQSKKFLIFNLLLFLCMALLVFPIAFRGVYRSIKTRCFSGLMEIPLCYLVIYLSFVTFVQLSFKNTKGSEFA